MIFDSKILSVQNIRTDAPKKVAGSGKIKVEKRKRKSDRRSSVRDGVIVNLSSESNRRRGVDRRKLQN